MASGFNVTEFAGLLKTQYDPKVAINMVSKLASPLYRLIEHKSDEGGDYYALSIISGDNPSGSATFSDALERSQNAGLRADKFLLPFNEDFSIAQISGKTIAVSRNNKVALANALKAAADSAIRMATHRRSIWLYGDGTGTVGQVGDAAPGATKTLTLLDKSTAYRFVPNMKVQFAASAADDFRDSGAFLTVASCDYANGKLTMSANLNTITGMAQGDTISVKGDRPAGATPTLSLPVGLGGWLFPFGTAPAANDSFFNVNRSASNYLWGWQVDASNGSAIDGLIEAANMSIVYGHAESVVACVSPANFSAISKIVQTQSQYRRDGVGGKLTGLAGVGVGRLVLFGYGDQEVSVIADPYQTDKQAFVGDPKAIVHYSAGPAPSVLNYETGEPLVKVSDDDAVQVRAGSYDGYGLRNPGACVHVKLA